MTKICNAEFKNLRTVKPTVIYGEMLSSLIVCRLAFLLLVIRLFQLLLLEQSASLGHLGILSTSLQSTSEDLLSLSVAELQSYRIMTRIILETWSFVHCIALCSYC